MKKKDIITVIIIAIILVALLAGVIYLANRHRFLKEDTPQGVIRSDCQIDGAFLYFQENGKMMRYNTLTYSVTKLCGHEKLNSECPLEHLSGSFFIYNNRIYFRYSTQAIGNVFLAYYDLKSGETHDLNIELERNCGFFLYDGKIYYIIDTDIFCIPADGTTVKKLTSCTNTEKIFMIADGRIFTYTYRSLSSSSLSHISYIYSYDIETLKKTEIHSFYSQNAYPVDRAQYFGGKIYMLLNIFDPTLDSVGNDGLTKLFRLNIETGEMKAIYNDQMYDFFLTENNIYCFPYKRRWVNCNYQDAFGNYNTTTITSCSESIIKLDHDGKNAETVYTNSDITYETRFIINDNLFGKFIGDCPKLGISAEEFYASLNLKTGEIKEVKIPE